MEKIDLLSLTLEEVENLIVSLGEKKFRGKQIFQWVNKGVKSIDEMTNISKDLQKKLKDRAYITNSTIYKKQVSKIDGTTKYLFALEDGNLIEGVIMIYKHGITACISSQIGCAMGCSFCASTINGLVRHLRAGEMIDQILLMQQDLGKRISNIVLMGSGEPLHNFEGVIHFLKIVNDENGLNIGNRHMTLSTCGLVPEIKKLADLQIPINLAISLHAATDEVRVKTMPIAKKYSIKELIDGCKYYLSKNNRRITFEYALIKGVNDSETDANNLSSLLKGLLCHVNLIPVNTIDENSFKKSNENQILKFQSILRKSGIEATIRREMGSDIDAACGQLRNKYLE
ncbi:23S rRNA (adenine(2503)-C(2))-methyltransferase RlmN [Serpentinicella alkaliphila]|uniref:Probable dual-specificity RNA methyltransferase RlmN n=1 Tax=Serpentinicella alkaliphila TaxID=1734049 RepID=A0A4R2TEB8_9FIRM|nr:23S rRNA (adenine(2503)-C(2))-methyltransferase RlmN [Serpentinicella alkaliphila]QUH26218.1 23S rRNA (adenine(2503)-C(2))-methyltransferase RlmN [Serpentinicella alkaliphila]TCQ01678.1 23S rRNA m(2)A-2503 methyltransferase [Serpentinicella alkaliphila]